MLHFAETSFAKLSILGLLATPILATGAPTPCVINGIHYIVDEIITRDVSIIGGGSSGTYSAIRLHDLGKNIAVVEQTGRLGKLISASIHSFTEFSRWPHADLY